MCCSGTLSGTYGRASGSGTSRLRFGTRHLPGEPTSPQKWPRAWPLSPGRRFAGLRAVLPTPLNGMSGTPAAISMCGARKNFAILPGCWRARPERSRSNLSSAASRCWPGATANRQSGPAKSCAGMGAQQPTSPIHCWRYRPLNSLTVCGLTQAACRCSWRPSSASREPRRRGASG